MQISTSKPFFPGGQTRIFIHFIFVILVILNYPKNHNLPKKSKFHKNPCLPPCIFLSLFSLPFPGVLLYSILVEPKLRNVKICLVLTKMDYAYRQMRNEALLMLQIEKLKTQVPQKISIFEASAITREGLDKIVEWIFE